MAVAPHAGPDLADHVQNRAARERVEAELERVRVDLVADQRADERRTAADQSGESEPRPRRAHAAEGADDPEALGRVVQTEADDQHRRKADRA